MADQLFKKRKNTRVERESAKKKMLSEKWLFVCEGSCTEPNYIESLIRFANAKTESTKLFYRIEGNGRNTISLVKSVDDLLSEIESFKIKSDIPYGQVFVLFDKDSFGEDNFDNAIRMASARGYLPIWSNECFELWFILHYEYLNADTGRKSYFKKLNEHLGVINYEDEKAIDVFSIIHSRKRIMDALRNAEKLNETFCHEPSYSKRVPCTQMFVLIRAFEKRLKIDFSSID